MFMGDGREAGLGPGDQDCGESPAARQTTEWGRREQEDEEERKAAAPHNLGVPGLGAPDITPTRHGTPSAGAGGHEMFMGDGRENRKAWMPCSKSPLGMRLPMCETMV